MVIWIAIIAKMESRYMFKVNQMRLTDSAVGCERNKESKELDLA